MAEKTVAEWSQLSEEEREKLVQEVLSDTIVVEIGFTVRSLVDDLRIYRDIVSVMSGLPSFMRFSEITVVPAGFFKYRVRVKAIQAGHTDTPKYITYLYEALYAHVGKWGFWISND